MRRLLRKKEGRTGFRRLPSLIWLAVSGVRLFQVQIDAFAQFLARFEMRDVLAGQCHGVARLRIAAHARRPVM